MASIQEIKRRIKAVTSTSQITKAMEMVSATKMRRAQEIALMSRPYAVESLRILRELSLHAGGYVPAIMRPRGNPLEASGQNAKSIPTALVLIAADRGLAGSFNANVFRTFERKYAHALTNPEKFVFISVGKKAEEFFARKGILPKAAFKGFGDYATPEEVRPLTAGLVEGFLSMQWDAAIVVSTHFRSTLRQDVLVREMLPIQGEKLMETIREIVPEYGRYSITNNLQLTTDNGIGERQFEYLIEPDPKSVMDALAPELVEIVLYDFMLEANASEHSARMVAMKNASENAKELKESLTLEYNKARQAAITREISEIVGGAEALTNI